MSRAKKIDANQPEIVKALRKVNCKVAITSGAGDGFPDLVVWTPYFRRILLIEIKDGDKSPSRQKLTPDQVKFHDEWAGCDILVISSVTMALIAVGATE